MPDKNSSTAALVGFGISSTVSMKFCPGKQGQIHCIHTVNFLKTGSNSADRPFAELDSENTAAAVAASLHIRTILSPFAILVSVGCVHNTW